ncbi:MAG TPA: shikimate dehydrogenase [Brevundimonas sp.]|jgi:shikimate dehydrogenase|uniref:shikimate dehydrogenase n=1 Tax=Brevundimonas sp. TaxID=1871086 RepID=UPI002E0FAFF5|nr:shikimate dehydrogenase [Brevundimonas sp.]
MSGPVTAGVAGRPIGHSLSPLIHTAWLQAAGIDGRYLAFEPADEADFARLVERIRAGALAGINVTAPFKEAALALADEATDTARAAGSANGLVLVDGRLLADSTDGLGLLEALAHQAPALDLTARAAVILGAGGAARAAVEALRAAGAPEIRLVNRTRARAEALAEIFGPPVRAAGPEALDGDAGLVVNAAVGGDLPDLSRLPAGAAVMDMTYKPLETPLLAAARARGLTPVDGLGMLIGQARPAFARFFGAPAPDLDVRALALAELARREAQP